MKKILHILGAVALVTACGGDDSSNNKDGGNNGDGSLNGFDTGLGGNDDGGGNGGDGGNCYAPVDMYIMQDRSGSMGTDCNIGDMTNSKWCHSVNALSGYFNSTKASGNAVALQFFPLANHQAAWCGTGDNYNVPAAPMGMPAYATLPTNTFDTLLNQQNTNGGGGTPTEAAIRGVTRFTAANRRGGRVTIGVLVTDGDPNGCDQNLTHLSNLLQAHFMTTTLRTFVIGMTGADFNNLEQIAQGGNGPMHPDAVGGLTDACGNGPGPCRHWNVGDGNPNAFIAALAAIQEASDGCKDGGGVVNPPN